MTIITRCYRWQQQRLSTSVYKVVRLTHCTLDLLIATVLRNTNCVSALAAAIILLYRLLAKLLMVCIRGLASSSVCAARGSKDVINLCRQTDLEAGHFCDDSTLSQKLFVTNRIGNVKSYGDLPVLHLLRPTTSKDKQTCCLRTGCHTWWYVTTLKLSNRWVIVAEIADLICQIYLFVWAQL